MRNSRKIITVSLISYFSNILTAPVNRKSKMIASFCVGTYSSLMFLQFRRPSSPPSACQQRPSKHQRLFRLLPLPLTGKLQYAIWHKIASTLKISYFHAINISVHGWEGVCPPRENDAPSARAWHSVQDLLRSLRPAPLPLHSHEGHAHQNLCRDLKQRWVSNHAGKQSIIVSQRLRMKIPQWPLTQ